MGTIPLDPIYLKQEIAEHLNDEDTVVDEDHPEHYFGARYQFDSPSRRSSTTKKCRSWHLTRRTRKKL